MRVLGLWRACVQVVEADAFVKWQDDTGEKIPGKLKVRAAAEPLCSATRKEASVHAISKGVILAMTLQ